MKSFIRGRKSFTALFVFLAAAVSIFTALAGCTKKGDDKGPVTISVWHYFNSQEESDGLKKLGEQFKAAHPERDITVDITFISREELMNQYTIGAVSGELPDIGMVDSPDMASYISLGVFADITDELNSWGQLDKFYPGPLSSTKDAKGRVYGLPNNSNCLTLAVNTDMLKASGINKKPETWEEFEAACAKLTDSSKQIYGFAMSAVPNEEGTFQLIPWLYAAGGSVSDLGSPESVRAIDFLTGLVKKGYMSKEVVNWTQGDAANAFVAGKAAMFEAGTWHVADPLPKIKNFTYEFTLLPKDKRYATVIGGENFGVCSSTKYKELCAEFLMMISSAENVAYWCELTGKIPVRSDSATLRDVWTKDKYISVFSDAMQYAVARGPHAEWPSISKAVYSAAQASILGRSDTETAMKGAAAQVAPILEKAPIAR